MDSPFHQSAANGSLAVVFCHRQHGNVPPLSIFMRIQFADYHPDTCVICHGLHLKRVSWGQSTGRSSFFYQETQMRPVVDKVTVRIHRVRFGQIVFNQADDGG
jgi:hypothetical protein